MLGHCYIVFTLIATSAMYAALTRFCIQSRVGSYLIFVKWLVSTVASFENEDRMKCKEKNKNGYVSSLCDFR